MAAEGFKVATAYVALTIADETVQAQITSAIEQACNDGGAAGGQDAVTQIAGALESGSDAIAAPIVDALIGAGQAGGAELAAALDAAIGEAAGAAGDAVAAITEVVTAADDADMELQAVFERIYRGGAGMSEQLAGAMIDALVGVEAETEGFSTTELAIFDEFFTTLQARGEAAAIALATQMRMVSAAAVSGADLMAAGSATSGAPVASAAGAGSAAAQIEKVGAAAKTTTGELGGMASLMAGPWSYALWGGLAVLPMLSGLFNDASASAATFTSAIAQDSGAVGDNTAATIQSALAKTDLSQISDQLGVSQAQLIEYAAGEANVQSQVTDAYNTKVGALQKAEGATRSYGRAAGGWTNEAQKELGLLEGQKAALDRVTGAVQDAITQDRAQSDALLAAEHSTQIYNAAVGDLVTKLALQNEQQQMNAQALNDSLAPQGQLSDAALQAALDYQQASNATGQYTNALNGLYGQYGATNEAQAQFTGALVGLKGHVTAGKDAIDLTTAAGEKNYQMFYQAATAAEGYSQKLYAQTGDSQAAQAALQKMAGQLDTAAKNAGWTDSQVAQLNEDLFHVKSPAEIVFTSNVDTMINQIDQLNNAIGLVTNNGQTGNPNFSLSPSGRATGGPVQAGQPYVVGEKQPELFVPQTDGYIYPSVPEGRAATGGGGAPVFQFYGTAYPTGEQMAELRREFASMAGVS